MFLSANLSRFSRRAARPSRRGFSLRRGLHPEKRGLRVRANARLEGWPPALSVGPSFETATVVLAAVVSSRWLRRSRNNGSRYTRCRTSHAIGTLLSRSCRTRNFCSSCQAKRAVLFAEKLASRSCLQVPTLSWAHADSLREWTRYSPHRMRKLVENAANVGYNHRENCGE